MKSPEISPPSLELPPWLEVVHRQVQAVKFGSVHITVREGRVVEIETSVRVRVDQPK